jgi:hypothetical protein
MPSSTEFYGGRVIAFGREIVNQRLLSFRDPKKTEQFREVAVFEDIFELGGLGEGVRLDLMGE